MAVPPIFRPYDSYAFFEAEQARWRQERDSAMAEARQEVAARQAAAAASAAQARARTDAERQHRELLAATRANRPKTFLETVPKSWMFAAGYMLSRGWKRRPSEIVVGYRRQP